MDKKTLFAVVLSVVIIIGSMLIQNKFFPVEEQAVTKTTSATEEETTNAGKSAPKGSEPSVAEKTENVEPKNGEATTAEQTIATGRVEEKKENIKERDIKIDNDLFEVVFSNRGGVIKSFRLKQFRNSDGTAVNMVYSGDSKQYLFNIRFGDFNSNPTTAIFNYRQKSQYKFEFYKEFISPSGVPFILRKEYYFPPHEYLIQLKIYIENSINEYPDLDFNGNAYSLEIGPQIGPKFLKLDNRNDYRRFVYYSGGKRRNVKLKDNLFLQSDRVTWAAIDGKYFTIIAVPDATQYRIVYDSKSIEGLKDRASIFFMRPIIKSSKNVDTFKFYVGPKKREILSRYNFPEKNTYKIGDLHFEEIVQSSILIGWLANILKFFLELFYKLIPNYGVGIILLTLFIKILLFPLTHKSYESTSKMQALSPKIEELKEKYKGKPEKLNQEMAELYKREGVNPLGGCLPMLLQLPIFFAIYNLLNNHFELRGAMFIPGWITDLSAPETIWHFSSFSIPLVGWHDLRLLPFIMLISSFLQSKVSQAPSASSSGSQMGNMKMMTYAMPLIFFFILYDMPSGLVLYWTVQGLFTVIQQLYINNIMKAKSGGDSGGTSGKSKKPKRRR